MAVADSTPSISQKPIWRNGLKISALPGERFGMFVVIREVKVSSPGTHVEARCDCGNVKIVLLSHIMRSTIRSCGCLLNGHKTPLLVTHGHCRGPHHSSGTYNSYRSMIRRCIDPTHDRWHRYGGRGIRVCDRWMESFENFLLDMGKRPEGMTLDRRDLNGNYSPENCRWTDWEHQYSNRRNSRFLEFNGERHTLTQWAKKLNISSNSLRYRIDTMKMSVTEAFTTPLKR